jgi:hypothetical protein
MKCQPLRKTLPHQPFRYTVAMMLLGGFVVAATLATEPWLDPTVTGINREPARAVRCVYPNVQSALAGKPEASRFYRWLNGTWKHACPPANQSR